MSIFNGRVPLQGGMQAIALAARLIGCGLSSTGGSALVPSGTSYMLHPLDFVAYSIDLAVFEAVNPLVASDSSFKVCSFS